MHSYLKSKHTQCKVTSYTRNLLIREAAANLIPLYSVVAPPSERSHLWSSISRAVKWCLEKMNNKQNAAGPHQQHTAGIATQQRKLDKLLSPASFNVFFCGISPFSSSSHIMYTCDFAHKRSLQTSIASSRLSGSLVPLLAFLSYDYSLCLPSKPAIKLALKYHK